MNWIFWVIAVIIFLVINTIIFSAIYDEDSVGWNIFGFILSAIPSVLLTILFMGGISLFSKPAELPYYRVTESHTCELVQSQVNHKIEGTMGLFYGRINDRDVYRFYVNERYNGYRLDYLYADQSSVVEINPNTEKPRVVYYDKIMYTNEMNWWQRNFFGERGWEKVMSKKKGHIGVLYVPKGTIIQNKFDGMNL